MAFSNQVDYYQILGVRTDATQKEIKKTYRKLAFETHPDRNRAPDAELRFKILGEAYYTLFDPEKREAYDRSRNGTGVHERPQEPAQKQPPRQQRPKQAARQAPHDKKREKRPFTEEGKDRYQQMADEAKFSDLIKVLEDIGVRIAIRLRVGEILVNRLAELGNEEMLRDIIGREKIDQQTRDKALKHLINKFKDMRRYADLVGLSACKGSPWLRRDACQSGINGMRREGDFRGLHRVAADRGLPWETRAEAVRQAKIYAAKKDIPVIKEMTRDGRFEAEFLREAWGTLRKISSTKEAVAFARGVAEDANGAPGARLAAGKFVLSMLRDSARYEEIRLVAMSPSMPIEIQREALSIFCTNRLQGLVNGRDMDAVIQMACDTIIPIEVRAKAGKAAIEILFFTESFGRLGSLKGMAGFPESLVGDLNLAINIAGVAERALKENTFSKLVKMSEGARGTSFGKYVGYMAVNGYARLGISTMLDAMRRHPGLDRKVRDYAESKIPEAKESLMERIAKLKNGSGGMDSEMRAKYENGKAKPPPTPLDAAKTLKNK